MSRLLSSARALHNFYHRICITELEMQIVNCQHFSRSRRKHAIQPQEFQKKYILINQTGV